MHMCMCESGHMRVEGGGQLHTVTSLLPPLCVFYIPSVGCQAWWQAPLTAEPSRWLLIHI